MVGPIQPQRGFWAEISAIDCASLNAVGYRRTYRRGATVLAQRETSGDVLIVRSGFAKVVVWLAVDKYVVLALRGPGDIIGELANINSGQRSADVIAVSALEAIRIPREHFRVFLDGSQGAAEVLSRTLVCRLMEADRDRLAAASMTVGQRLARLLLKLVQRYGVPAQGGGVTIGMLSQKELAACVGGAVRTVVRQIAQWRDRRIISTTRRSVTVHQPDLLIQIAGRGAPPP